MEQTEIRNEINGLVSALRDSEYAFGSASHEDREKIRRNFDDLVERMEEGDMNVAIDYAQGEARTGRILSLTAPITLGLASMAAFGLAKSFGVVDDSQVSELGNYLPALLGVYGGVMLGVCGLVVSDYWSRVGNALRSKK